MAYNEVSFTLLDLLSFVCTTSVYERLKDLCDSGVEDDQTPVSGQEEVVVVEQQPEEQEVVEAQTAVVSVVEAGSQEVLHQVHFTMEVDGTTQEQQVGRKRWPKVSHGRLPACN